jgi:class 3 adenylate cyclase
MYRETEHHSNTRAALRKTSMTMCSSDVSLDYGYDSGEEGDATSTCSVTLSVETRNETEDPPPEGIATDQTLVITRLRQAVLIALALASVIVSAVVYTSSKNTESVHFHQHFREASDQVLNVVPEKVQRQLGAIDGLALDLSSYARRGTNGNGNVNVTWPLVTLPDFDMRGGSTRSLADALSIMLLPVVTEETRTSWEEYSVNHQDWIPQPQEEVVDVDVSIAKESEQIAMVARRQQEMEHQQGIPKEIFNANGTVQGPGPFLPLWQMSPVLPGMTWMFNMDMLSITAYAGGLSAVLEGKGAVLGQVSNLKSGDDQSSPALASLHHHLVLSTSTSMSASASTASITGPNKVPHADPVSPLFYPVLDKYGSADADADVNVVAVLATLLSWRSYLNDILSPGVKGVVCVVQNKCGQAFTYQIDGHDATYLGEGDHHDSKFNDLGKTVDLVAKVKSSEDLQFGFGTSKLNGDYCSYSLSVYPSNLMQKEYITGKPAFHVFEVAFLFTCASLLFLAYDWLVERRQKLVLEHAHNSNSIVSSLFPDVVRDRLFRRESGDGEQATRRNMARQNSTSTIGSKQSLVEPTKNRIQKFLSEGGGESKNAEVERPLADLFPNCTVLFADIAGFTAWSSLRDPSQVFTLLESVYQSFDKIARKRGVFKVETIGDSYVAVTGLPDPQDEHAVIMTRFARDCKNKFRVVTRKLELTLGPDTGDLLMRFGLHSGPVTAGVLRGEKSRFQLFGDTVNTAARMESTGEKDRIQASQSTADQLIAAGRGRWVKARDKMVQAKGKGALQTYWIEPSMSKSSRADSICSTDESGVAKDPKPSKDLWGGESEIPESQTQRSKHQRLVDYNVEVLCQHLKQIVARRMVIAASGRRDSEGNGPPNLEIHRDSNESTKVLEEVTEIIKLPNFDPRAFKDHVDPSTIELEPKVVSQMKRYVTIIAAMYRNNPFHNFEHASHVTMSMNKLLQRVTAPDIQIRKKSDKKAVGSQLHKYTYGITSDPLTQFALVFAALIHDCDHWGVSNAQLIKEGVPIADKYRNKSVAEQNSVDLAWDLLMEADEYGDLQRCLFPTDDEYKRFRQVVVNIVMSTDIFDKELEAQRKNRWSKAFDEPKQNEEEETEYDKDLKATIVIEHIMQASDVAHTMQHWHVYQKWNRRLFDELYTAHRAGRMGVDPVNFWYKGELGFFDNYIIPLAQKLKDCGVFGVSSDECLNYAMENRREWAAKGEQIVLDLVASFEERDTEDEGVKKNATATNRKKLRCARRRSLITNGG